MSETTPSENELRKDRARFDAARELKELALYWAPRTLTSVDLPHAKEKAKEARNRADKEGRALDKLLGLPPGSSDEDRQEARDKWQATFDQLRLVIDQADPLRRVLDRIAVRAGMQVQVSGGMSHTKADDLEILDEVERCMRESLVPASAEEQKGDDDKIASDAYLVPDQSAEELRKAVLRVIPDIRNERMRAVPDIGWLRPLARSLHRGPAQRLQVRGGAVSELRQAIREAMKRQRSIFDRFNELRKKREAIAPANQRVRQVVDTWRLALTAAAMDERSVTSRQRNLELLGLEQKTPEVVAMQVHAELTRGAHAQRLRSAEKRRATNRRMGGREH